MLLCTEMGKNVRGQVQEGPTELGFGHGEFGMSVRHPA